MGSSRRPTIIDVARHVGVSKSTVSLVLQNSTTVKEETRQLVRKGMKELGYVYNRAAANMRSSNAGLVGLVINDLRNPFFTEFATSLQMALAQRGYATVIGNTDEDPELQVQMVGSMIEHGVSALLICPAYGQDAAAFDAIARAGLPALQMLRQVDDRLSQFPFIAPDYAAGSRLAAEHLLAMGAQRIAFVGGVAGRPVTEERKAGYVDVLSERGLEPVVLSGRASRMFGIDAAEILLKEHPDVDAAVCFNDLVALGVQAGFRRLGMAAPEGFRIVGFDDIEEAAQSYPPLSSVRCNIADIGEDAAATVVNWLEKGTVPQPETRTAVQVVARQSSSP